MATTHFMGLDGFVWFVGVVEDRNDPDKLGRVRVRCLGFHSEKLTDLPSDDLPWAHVMHPVTDPSMHGMGNTPSFLVEGAWVVGFFRDADTKQQPIIIGSLPGVPKEPKQIGVGFQDPRHLEGMTPYAYSPETRNEYGPYPLGQAKDTSADPPSYSSRASGHTYGESDTNRLARQDTAETHGALVNRRGLRKTALPIATQPHIPNVEQLSVNGTKKADPRLTWDEPHPKGHEEEVSPYMTAKYPLNHVFESESGHIFEVDDSPGGERLLREHKSGTFEEIHPTGDKVVRVRGDNYEIIAGKSNVFIDGDVNLTITGTKKELIMGDYILEVKGNLTHKIHKNHKIKVGAGTGGGNRYEEINGNYGYNINDHVNGRIGGHRHITIEKEDILTINDYRDMLVVNNIFQKSATGKTDILTATNMTLRAVINDLSMSAGTIMHIKSGSTMNIKTELDGLNITSVGLVTETFQASQVTNITGTLNLSATGLVTETFGASQDTNITGALNIDTTGTIDTVAGTIFTIESGGGSPSATNKVDINPT